MARRLVRTVLPLLGYAVTYALATVIGRATRVDGGDISLAWPAAAVAVLWGIHASGVGKLATAVHAAVLAGVSWAATDLSGGDTDLALWFAGVNLALATVATVVLRYDGRPVRLREPADLTRLVAAVSAGSLVGAGLAVAFFAFEQQDHLAQKFVLFTVRNGVTALVGVALVLRLRDVDWRRTARPDRSHLLEGVACAVVVSVLFVRIFWFNQGLPTGFAIMLPAVWVALRFSTATSTVFVAVAGTFVLWTTLLDRGPLRGIEAEQQAFLAEGTVGSLTLVVLALALIRDSRDALIEKLRHLALRDPLTGLANRTLLLERLDGHLDRPPPVPRSVGVIFVDLDGFKRVNDAWGHREGDLLLNEMARRISAAVRPSDLVARLGGDEFVIACSAIADTDELHELAERIRCQIAEPYGSAVDAPFDRITASIGYALSDGKSSAKSLLAAADRAMYEAKRSGRNRTVRFPGDQSSPAWLPATAEPAGTG